MKTAQKIYDDCAKYKVPPWSAIPPQHCQTFHALLCAKDEFVNGNVEVALELIEIINKNKKV